MPPNKNTTLGALGRAVGAVVNSSDPLNETKALSQGLEMHKSETAALLKGQSGIVTYVSFVNASPSPAGDLRCFVDPATGQLVGLEQSGSVACSVASDVVVVPTSTAGYISQVKLAYTYDGAFVGRLIFDVKSNATAKAVSYTCGSAGGKAVNVLPSGRDYAVTRLAVGCAPLPAIDGGSGGVGRRLRAAPGLGLSQGSFGVTAAPLSVLPVDPATGIPRAPSLGDFLAPSPTVVNVTSTASGRIDVSFTPSSDLGAPPIARYVVACLPYAGTTPACAATGVGVQSTSVAVGATPQASVFGLADGAQYVCYAIASNGVGGNACSAASAVTTVATWRLAAGDQYMDGSSNGYGRIWRSTDSGASWTDTTTGPRAPQAHWRSIASSSDGSKLAAVIEGDRIWRSTDSGASWTEAYAPQADWYSIASSSDGSKLAAVINGDRIWRSTDSGASWTEVNAPQADWRSIASSSDGSKLAAVIRQWTSIASSA